MTAPDRALAALIAAFAPARAAELSAYLAPLRGAGVRAAAEALIRGGRSARLDGLARCLGPPQAVRAAAAGSEGAPSAVAPLNRRGERLRERFVLEGAAGPRASSGATQSGAGS